MQKEFVKVSNEQGLECCIVPPSDGDRYETIMGGDDSNPSWAEFLDQFKEEYQPHISLIKKAIEDNNLVGERAERCANNLTFLFSDKTHIAFTWRGWGDLMQAIVDKKEGYMAYYM